MDEKVTTYNKIWNKAEQIVKNYPYYASVFDPIIIQYRSVNKALIW